MGGLVSIEYKKQATIRQTKMRSFMKRNLFKDWIATGDNRSIERKYNVSPNTVLSIVKRSGNPDALAILAAHREWNSE